MPRLKSQPSQTNDTSKSSLADGKYKWNEEGQLFTMKILGTISINEGICATMKIFSLMFKIIQNITIYKSLLPWQ